MKRILPTLLAVVQVICLLLAAAVRLCRSRRMRRKICRPRRKNGGRGLHGSVSHPAHRIVQLGFMEKAEELGYEGHILSLDAGSMQELYDCWLKGAKEHDIAGEYAGGGRLTPRMNA